MSLTIKNASVTSWSPSTGKLQLNNPVGKVSVNCIAEALYYRLSLNAFTNGASGAPYGFEQVKVYYTMDDPPCQSEANEIDIDLSNVSYTTLPHGCYYWVDAKVSSDDSNYATVSQGRFTASTTVNIYYYSVELVNISGVINYPSTTRYVLSGQSIGFYATRKNSGYSTTINWSKNIGTLSSFTTTSGATVYKTINSQTQFTLTCAAVTSTYTFTVGSENNWTYLGDASGNKNPTFTLSTGDTKVLYMRVESYVHKIPSSYTEEPNIEVPSCQTVDNDEISAWGEYVDDTYRGIYIKPTASVGFKTFNLYDECGECVEGKMTVLLLDNRNISITVSGCTASTRTPNIGNAITFSNPTANGAITINCIDDF